MANEGLAEFGAPRSDSQGEHGKRRDSLKICFTTEGCGSHLCHHLFMKAATLSFMWIKQQLVHLIAATDGSVIHTEWFFYFDWQSNCAQMLSTVKKTTTKKHPNLSECKNKPPTGSVERVPAEPVCTFLCLIAFAASAQRWGLNVNGPEMNLQTPTNSSGKQPLLVITPDIFIRYLFMYVCMKLFFFCTQAFSMFLYLHMHSLHTPFKWRVKEFKSQTGCDPSKIDWLSCLNYLSST